jgi:hypothetical protein
VALDSAHDLHCRLNPDLAANRILVTSVEPTRRRWSPQQGGSAVLSFEKVEEVCGSKSITLVVHPAVRRAIKGYEESFYIGLSGFLRGASDGMYFLPLHGGAYVRLVFSQRRSAGGYPILRVDPLTDQGLQRIKLANEEGG